MGIKKALGRIGIIVLAAIATADADATADGITDSRDGKTYKAVKIGDHTWMAENLNYKTGQSWCYDDDESTCAKYGRLYDWKTAKSACPKGWHLPDTAEWNRLTAAVGGGPRIISDDNGDVYYEGVGKTLKSKTGWSDYNGNSCNGTDDFGFSATPGGYRGIDRGTYNLMEGYFWSATEGKSGGALRRNVNCRDDNLNENDAYVRHGYGKSHGFSVRCVQDYASPARGVSASANANTSAVTVAIKQITSADSVKIGKNTWINQNINIETKGSWCFDDDKSYCAKYGRLYTYEAAKSVCTSLGSGWRLPTKEDWNDLVNYAGGTEIAGQKLRAKSGWYKRGNGSSGNGTDDYGFSALPGGYRAPKDNYFGNAGSQANFWSATGGGTESWGMHNHIDEVSEDSNAKGYGYSVRCVKE